MGERSKYEGERSKHGRVGEKHGGGCLYVPCAFTPISIILDLPLLTVHYLT